jgi:nitroreductase
MARRAAAEGTILRVAEGPARYHLACAIHDAARQHTDDPAYRIELAAWSGRRAAADGVPTRNAPAPDDTPGALPGRPFADPELRQPTGTAGEDDETVLLVLATASDDRMSQLRAGEATSAALLTATSLGLATCPLTEPLEIADTRETVRTKVTGGGYPQMVIRLGWAPLNADPLPATPRRGLDDVLTRLGTAKLPPGVRRQGS